MVRLIRQIMRARQSATAVGDETDRCVVPRFPVPDSPLRSELRALLDHAERLEWLSARESRPEEYRAAARAAVAALVVGWQIQRPGGTVSDLLPCEADTWADAGRQLPVGEGPVPTSPAELQLTSGVQRRDFDNTGSSFAQ